MFYKVYSPTPALSTMGLGESVYLFHLLQNILQSLSLEPVGIQNCICITLYV